MNEPRLFIGLITHGRSRFNASGEAVQALSELTAATESRGIRVSSLVSERDDYSPDILAITRRRLVASAMLQGWLEFRWRRFVSAGRGDTISSLPRDLAVLIAMEFRRLHSYLGRNPLRSAALMPGARQAIRLLNIDLSHLRAYEAALQSDAEAILVIEDDARMSDVAIAGEALEQLLPLIAVSDPRFANLSESLSWAELGVSGIVGSPLPGVTHDAVQILSCSRPVTNTVCANLFSRSFVEMLREDIIDHGLSPIIPIDWRVNRMIMRAWKSGQLDDRACVWVSPGIFVQGSMHSS